MEAVKEFPSSDTKLLTQKGRAFMFKMDLFKKVLFFMYEGEKGESPIELPLKRVKEIIELNKKGKKPESLRDLSFIVKKEDHGIAPVQQDSLTRFDGKYKKSKNKKRRKTKGKKFAKKPK